MDVAELIQYVLERPLATLGAAAGLIALYYLLNRKSKLTREAEKRIAQLHKERGDYYRGLRPPN